MAQLKDNLVSLRKAKHLSQAQVADKLFVTPQAVSRWERGETEPDVDTLVKIAEIYGVSVEEVVSGPSHGLTQKLEKIFHLVYLFSSLFLIVCSLIVISSLLWTSRPLTFFIIFLILAILYLLLIMAIEITKDILKRKTRREKDDNKNK